MFYCVVCFWTMLINHWLANEHICKPLPIYTLSRHNMSNAIVMYCSNSSDGPPNPEKNVQIIFSINHLVNKPNLEISKTNSIMISYSPKWWHQLRCFGPQIFHNVTQREAAKILALENLEPSNSNICAYEMTWTINQSINSRLIWDLSWN